MLPRRERDRGSLTHVATRGVACAFAKDFALGERSLATIASTLFARREQGTANAITAIVRNLSRLLRHGRYSPGLIAR